MRPRPWSAFATWLTRPLPRFVASLRKLAKQRGAKQARKHADRARERAALAKRRELAAHARAINLHEQAAARCRNVSAILTRAARARAHAEHARELQGLALKEQREQKG